MSKTNNTTEPQKDKVMTKYDRKVQQRKLMAEKDKRENFINKIIAIVVAVAIVAAIVISIGISTRNRMKALSETFVQIGDHEITGVEYDFYYNTVVSNYLNAYSSVLPYVGLDPSVDFAAQQYDENMTWQDAFDEMTVDQIKEIKAMIDDAKVKGFVYETEKDDYKAFKEGFNSKAETAGMPVSEYYKSMFGEYASESRLEPFVKETLLVTAYTKKLNEDYKPSEDEIQKKYEENKKDYDLVDYYAYSFYADTTEEDSEEKIATAMEEVMKKAETMKSERVSGKKFQELCDSYQAEIASDTAEATDDATEIEEDKDKNLFVQNSYGAVPSTFAEWLFDETRKAGDLEIFTDDVNQKVTVVEFVNRAYNEETNTIISNQVISESLTNYTNELTQNYKVTDVAGKLEYLSNKETTNDASVEDAETEEEPIAEE